MDTRAQAKNKFHFSRLVRKKDIAVMRKKKKREWLRKLYMEGIAKEVEEGRVDIVDKQARVTQELIEGGDGKGLKMFEDHMNLAGTGGEEFIEVGEDGVDVEIEKLLTWTQELDYDGYIDEWNKLGTSLGSDARIGGKKAPPGVGMGSGRGSGMGASGAGDDSSMMFDYGLGAY